MEESPSAIDLIVICKLQIVNSSDGGVAQLGEHLPCKQGVRGSIPLISTKGQITNNK